MAFSGNDKNIPSLKHSHGSRDRGAPVANFECAGRCGQNRGTDCGGIFGARIVIGHNDHIGTIYGDFAHDRTLARVPVTAAAEDHDKPA